MEGQREDDKMKADRERFWNVGFRFLNSEWKGQFNWETISTHRYIYIYIHKKLTGILQLEIIE